MVVHKNETSSTALISNSMEYKNQKMNKKIYIFIHDKVDDKTTRRWQDSKQKANHRLHLLYRKHTCHAIFISIIYLLLPFFSGNCFFFLIFELFFFFIAKTRHLGIRGFFLLFTNRVCECVVVHL